MNHDKIEFFALSNGFAATPNFPSTLAQAVAECVKESRSMNTRNWLYREVNGTSEEIGHTIKDGPMSWSFVYNG